MTAIYQNETADISALMNEAQQEGAEIVALNRAVAPALNQDKYPGYYLYNENGDLDDSFIVSRFSPLKAGKILFSPRFVGSYMMILAGNQPLVFVNIDFRGLSHQEEAAIYHNLEEFVVSQDNPVVIIGDFGIPAWSRTFQKFLNKTSLEVKNHIILSNGSSWFNPLGVPSLNVLAYKNFGVNKVRFLDKKGNSKHPLLIELSF